MEKGIKQNDFSQGSIPQNILSIGIPMIIAQLVNIMYNLVDRMFLGRMPAVGSLALTGVGITLPLITLITAFARLCGLGGVPLCSIQRGMGNDDEAEAIIGHSVTMLLIVGVILTVAGLIFREPLLYFFGASDVTIVYAMDYISIYLVGTVFVMLSLGLNGYINCQGFGKTGMFTTMLGALVNIILDPIFIFALDMGVKGAALATVIAQGCSAVWVMAFLLGKKTLLRIRLKNMVLDIKRVGKILSMGAMGFCMALTNSIVQTAANTTLQLFGGDLYVGVMTIISSVREVFMLPMQGIAGGAEPVIGYNYGAKEYRRVREGIGFMMITGIVFASVVTVIAMVFPEMLIKIYNSEEQMLAVGVRSMRLYFCCFFMMGLQMGGQSAFVSLGRSKYAIFFSMLRKTFIVAPLTLILPRVGFGVDGVFIAELVSDVVGSTACATTMYFTVWREMKRLEKEALEV